MWNWEAFACRMFYMEYWCEKVWEHVGMLNYRREMKQKTIKIEFRLKLSNQDEVALTSKLNNYVSE